MYMFGVYGVILLIEQRLSRYKKSFYYRSERVSSVSDEE